MALAKEMAMTAAPRKGSRPRKGHCPTNDLDSQVVRSTVMLLQKLATGDLAGASAKRSIKSALRSFESRSLIDCNRKISIELVGPRCWFGKTEVLRWWTVHLEDECLHVSSGGHTFQEGHGCDTFIAFTWDAAPDMPAEYKTYPEELSRLPMVQPFGTEVEQLDLSEPGYAVSVFDSSFSQKPTAPSQTDEKNSRSIETRADDPCEICGRPLSATRASRAERISAKAGPDSGKLRPRSKSGSRRFGA